MPSLLSFNSPANTKAFVGCLNGIMCAYWSEPGDVLKKLNPQNSKKKKKSSMARESRAEIGITVPNQGFSENA